jgi:hypothetical protein
LDFQIHSAHQLKYSPRNYTQMSRNRDEPWNIFGELMFQLICRVTKLSDSPQNIGKKICSLSRDSPRKAIKSDRKSHCLEIIHSPVCTLWCETLARSQVFLKNLVIMEFFGNLDFFFAFVLEFSSVPQSIFLLEPLEVSRKLVKSLDGSSS